MTLPLVLLHAFPLDHRMFEALQLPMPVITPDQRGFGGRPLADPDGTVPVPDLSVVTADVIAALDVAGIERAVIGGVSMGGYVALDLLSRHPGRVAGLVLADTKSAADTSEGVERRLAMAAAADDGDLPDGNARIGSLISFRTVTERPDVAERLARISQEQDPAAIAWAQRAMAARADTQAVLATCRVPVLGIVGSDDTVTGVEVVRDLAASAPFGSLVEIEGSGHLAAAEDPRAFGAAIGRWWTHEGFDSVG